MAAFQQYAADLSAETAAGAWPVEAVTIMDRIAGQVERDPGYQGRVHYIRTPPDATTADALAQSAATIAQTVTVAGIIVFTGSGSTALAPTCAGRCRRTSS